jgi:hypothetical protein
MSFFCQQADPAGEVSLCLRSAVKPVELLAAGIAIQEKHE